MSSNPGDFVGVNRPASAASRVPVPRTRLDGRVLVVEDDPDIRSMTASILRVAGATVSAVSVTFDAATRIWRDLSESPEAVYRDGYRLVRSGWDSA